MWYPSLPNNGKVKVTISIMNNDTVYFLDHYHTLNIEPFVERDGNKYYLSTILVNTESIICTPKLYLDKYIDNVTVVYREFSVGGVIDSALGVSFANYLPQIGDLFTKYSFPRTSIYKGIKIGLETINANIFAFPVDLDKEDFEIWYNGIKYTLHLNRDNKVDNNGIVVSLFDIIKAEFYGELLPAERIDDYIELKPKGD